MAGMVDHKGKAKISFRNQRKKDMKEKAKRKGKREFEYALHRPIEFTFYLD